MSCFLGMVGYEYRMSIRRWGFWLGFLAAILLTLDSLDLPLANLEHPTTEAIRFYAGTVVYKLNFSFPIVAGILIADRMVRDQLLKVDEVLLSTPLMRLPYILGKYLGSLLSVLTPPLLIVLLLGAISSIVGHSLSYLGWFLMAFAGITLPAYAFITIFSLACPLVMPLRVYQVLFTGYWVWGNFLSPEVFPTLNGTLLTPSGSFVMDSIFRNSMSSVHTPIEAVLNLTVLFLCILAAVFSLNHFLAQQAQAA